MMTFIELLMRQKDMPEDMIIEGKNRNTKIMFHSAVTAKKSRVVLSPDLSEILEYQKKHAPNVIKNTDYVFSFWYEDKRAKFIGTYKMGPSKIESEENVKTGERRIIEYFAQMEEIDFLKEFRDKLVIEWTKPNPNYLRWIVDNKYTILDMK
ncbi:MAG: hypothetical protein M0R76_05265 [Proteobacteria bacterium]|nr:hypothetical protein [Pseudomonadota bacterium]